MVNAVNKLAREPKILFLIDALGALLSAFLLFVVLRNFNEYFGMPETILTYLAAIAALLCTYSMACFLFLRSNWTPFVRAISIANLLYCILTAGLLIKYFTIMTFFGLTYFLLEIALVCGLVYIELKVATRIKQ
ncbi:MAG TPA: hypothetical protein VEC36_13500 [Patescibacteria group bacterium]|nr:hypothetical protein [Patescibacteria group bacterium]